MNRAPITRKTIRDKVEDLLKPGLIYTEYRKSYPNSDGEIGNTPPDGSRISNDSVNALLDGMFNDTTVADMEIYTAVVITSKLDGVETTHYVELPDAETEALIEADATKFIHTDDDGNETNLSNVTLTSSSVAYDWDLHGDPIEDGTISYTYMVPQKGTFFQDLNTDCLLAAAVYELAKDEIDDLQSQIDQLKLIINNMG